MRESKLAQDPICEIRTHCSGAVGTDMDHIVPVKIKPEWRFEWANVQTACHTCHAAKTFRERRMTLADFTPLIQQVSRKIAEVSLTF